MGIYNRFLKRVEKQLEEKYRREREKGFTLIEVLVVSGVRKKELLFCSSTIAYTTYIIMYTFCLASMAFCIHVYMYIYIIHTYILLYIAYINK
ncbi:MAG: prepilin-type N-terminal cleavage/methylation domain-containing protein [Aquificota bacterium]|nr:prepilin-type N-terminal cleavage/methylation domain-containing protein [Aquificota bacterium]